MTFIITILLIASALGLLSLLFKILKTPIKLALKLLVNAIVGFLSLVVVNLLGSFIGISLGVNWLNAIIVGLLGLPGVILLLLLKYLL
ncbi:MAG TPA: pro-sigmaK processing inhibitor BofA [Clostridiales bacterium]|jgi:inhibitor of the pro-sigma K processing machinery|nr:pro-sigmaK processing inhibitor BofA [Clostridiales bacterium]